MRLHPPLAGPLVITQPFGVNETAYRKFDLPGHEGTDYLAATGTPVMAVDDGLVALSSTTGAYGLHYRLVHGWGESVYAHLSKLLVTQGQRVSKGQVIGLSGSTGNSDGPHLHFGLRVNPFFRDSKLDLWQGFVNPKNFFLDEYLLISPHIHTGGDSMIPTLRQWQPVVATVLDPNVDFINNFAAVSPKTEIVARIYVDDSAVAAHINRDPKEAAKWMHSMILAHPAFATNKIRYWQIANEVCQGPNWDEFVRLNTCMDEWMTLAGTAYKCGLFAFGVGHPDVPKDDPNWWNLITPTLIRAQKEGHVILAHEYGVGVDLNGPADRGGAPFHIQRLNSSVLHYLQGLARDAQFIISETGYDGLLVGDKPAGWRSTERTPEVYTGELLHLNDRYAMHRNQIKGVCVYTWQTANKDRWTSYDIDGDVAQRLAARAEQVRGGGEPLPPTPPIPPTPPTPIPDSNEAKALGVTVTPMAAGAAAMAWRLRRVYVLSGAQNAGGHNLYVEAYGLDGQKLRGVKAEFVYQFGGFAPHTVTLDKPLAEFGTNEPMYLSQVYGVRMADAPSDFVDGVSTKHADGEPGNTMGHWSFVAEFQQVKLGDTPPDPEPVPPAPPTGTRPPTVSLSAANVASLRTYPRPPKDNGIGLHFHTDLSDFNIAKTVEHLTSIRATWTMIYAQDELQAERAALACFRAGIMPVVRVGKLITDQVNSASYVAAMKRALVQSGMVYDADRPPLYVQCFNEPEDSREWKDGLRPANWPQVFAAKWTAEAVQVVAVGGYPGLQVLDRRAFDAVVDAVNAAGAQHVWERAWFCHHNYGVNHPPSYPYDARNQQDKPGQTIADDYQCVLKPMAHALWMQERLGFVLPFVGGEGGWWVGNEEDRRYPKLSWTGLANYTREMFEWFRLGVLSNGEPLPDYLFSITPWIAESPTFFSQAWWGNGLSPDGTATETIAAVQSISVFERLSSWDAPGPVPPDDLIAAAFAAAKTHQRISLDPNGALQKAMIETGCAPTSGEFGFSYEGAGYVAQWGEHLTRKERPRLYFCEVGRWDDVREEIEP